MLGQLLRAKFFSRLTSILIGLVYIFLAVPLAQAQSSDSGGALNAPFISDSSDCAPSSSGGNSSSGKVYLIGDSIANGTKSELETSLKAKGFSDVYINAVDSRSLSEGTEATNGITVLSNDSANYSDADTIIVELGTNNGEISADNISKVISIIRQANLDAKIFWVNVGVVNDQRDTPIDADAIDKSLRENAGTDYSVIDWKRVVDAHPEYISDLGVHPFTEEGKRAFATTVADGSAVISSSAANNTSGCACGASSLTGSDNEEKIWNFFSDKMEPFQVAGMMGNMQAESHFEPKLVQYGKLNTRGEISVAGEPSSLDDTPPPERPDQGPSGTDIGYGIVQWTAGTKILPGLDKYNQKNGSSVSAGDLDFQVNLLWDQLSGGDLGAEISEKPAGDALLATSTLEEATTVFLHRYERPGVPNDSERLGFAQTIMQKYGSGTGTVPGGSTCGDIQGPTGGTLAWPENPATSHISQCFTWNGTSGHPGMDIFSGQGQPIFAAADGIVTKAGPVDGYGDNYVAIKHNNGFGTGYGHMSSKLVNEGDTVKQGQQIGTEGDEGYSHGSHLHFNVFPGEYGGTDGPNVNPLANGLSIPPEVDNQAGCK